jgi:hypothetical protein
VTRDQPRELVRVITEAIDRIAPGRGDEIYWRAFERWEAALQRSSRQLTLPLASGADGFTAVCSSRGSAAPASARR